MNDAGRGKSSCVHEGEGASEDADQVSPAASPGDALRVPCIRAAPRLRKWLGREDHHIIVLQKHRAPPPSNRPVARGG